jgi:hypothetical protein
LKAPLEFIWDGDTLVTSTLERLARSVKHWPASGKLDRLKWEFSRNV